MKKLTPRQVNTKRKAEGKPPLNFKLFSKVIRKLETAPEAYDQNTVAYRSERSPCGTVACIGGWADILSAPSLQAMRRRVRNLSLDRAGRALGVTQGGTWVGEGEESLILFNNADAGDEDAWPSPFAEQLGRAKTPLQRSRVAIRYLRRIMATGEVK